MRKDVVMSYPYLSTRCMDGGLVYLREKLCTPCKIINHFKMISEVEPVFEDRGTMDNK
jgi:hypothetical protein